MLSCSTEFSKFEMSKPQASACDPFTAVAPKPSTSASARSPFTLPSSTFTLVLHLHLHPSELTKNVRNSNICVALRFFGTTITLSPQGFSCLH